MAERTETRPFELAVEFTDPYKRTSLFIQDGKAFYGLWRAPSIELDGDEPTVIVPLGLEGSLDIISQLYLGDRKYWRALAHVNKIDFPREEVKAGDEIIIPKLERVRAAYRVAGNQVEDA